jgi:hypothetical protein
VLSFLRGLFPFALEVVNNWIRASRDFHPVGFHYRELKSKMASGCPSPSKINACVHDRIGVTGFEKKILKKNDLASCTRILISLDLFNAYFQHLDGITMLSIVIVISHTRGKKQEEEQKKERTRAGIVTYYISSVAVKLQ